MAYSVLVTEAFEADVIEAVSYCIEVLDMPKAAAELMEDIDAAKELIASAPLLYPVSQYAMVGKGSYREKIVRSYVLVYRVREKDETVVLARMFHQRENYMRQVAEWD